MYVYNYKLHKQVKTETQFKNNLFAIKRFVSI